MTSPLRALSTIFETGMACIAEALFVLAAEKSCKGEGGSRDRRTHSVPSGALPPVMRSRRFRPVPVILLPHRRGRDDPRNEGEGVAPKQAVALTLRHGRRQAPGLRPGNRASLTPERPQRRPSTSRCQRRAPASI